MHACTLFLALASTLHAFPLDSVFARSDSFVNIEWRVKPENIVPAWFATCCPSDTSLQHADFTANTEHPYRGEAYSYGGEDPWHLFRMRLDTGALAGSHLCHYTNSNAICGDPTPRVTGTDCSGFLCYVWNVPRISTREFAGTYQEIPKKQLRPGDALVKSGSHAVLVVDTAGFPDLIISESTGTPYNTCRERYDVDTATYNLYKAYRNTSISAATHVSLVTKKELRKITAGSLFSLSGRRIGTVNSPANLNSRQGSGVYIVRNSSGLMKIPLIKK